MNKKGKQNRCVQMNNVIDNLLPLSKNKEFAINI